MENYIWHDIRTVPFTVHGVFAVEGEDTMFRRVPKEVAESTNDAVAFHSKVSAGGRVRFRSDATKLGIRVKTKNTGVMWCGTPLLHYGCDLYAGKDFLGSTRFSLPKCEDYEWEFTLPQGEKELTLFLPCHCFLQGLELGFLPEASLSAPAPYPNEKPVVFYGSSITQGGYASRPGLGYTAQISRKLGLDYLNLGFSGGCRAESAIVNYIAGLDMMAFVCDYDHNASSQHLQETHYSVYETVRAKHPDIPIYLVTRPDFSHANTSDVKMRVTVMESYLRAYRNGDRNVYFIDGSAFFHGADLFEYTVDRTHPNDLGMQKMAESIGDVLMRTL